MISVEEADQIILSKVRDWGSELIPFESGLGRVLSEPIRADRDLPPYDRVTMDGIAIQYESIGKSIGTFRIRGTQAAGDKPLQILNPDDCIEIMTGAVLPPSADTVVRYEDLELANGQARLKSNSIKKGQNIHRKGVDKKVDEVVADAGQWVNPPVINLAAATGHTQIIVRKLPRVVVISSGDELTELNQTPSEFQVRRSNGYTVRAALRPYGINAELLHIPDDVEISRLQLEKALKDHDAVILSGGVSMGKFDFVPRALELLGVKKFFHKVSQKPGKPFWFGESDSGCLVFAFPGNPVSTFMCLYRYFLPWLKVSLGLRPEPPVFAALTKAFQFDPPLQYFLQVSLHMDEKARLTAEPREGHGSGDFANLAEVDAFMELPKDQGNFLPGEIFRVWPFGSVPNC